MIIENRMTDFTTSFPNMPTWQQIFFVDFQVFISGVAGRMTFLCISPWPRSAVYSEFSV
jgi:hypothetical protein